MTNDLDDDEREESPREQSRRLRREAGARSGRVSHALLQLTDPEFDRLQLDGELREAALRARKTTARVARRREERRLAGVLRRLDLAEVEAQLEEQQASRRADARLFKQAEDWRSRLLEDDGALDAFLSDFSGLERDRIAELVTNGQAEDRTGKPRGAKKLLFREVMAALQTRERESG